jgi:hypothetical protein
MEEFRNTNYFCCVICEYDDNFRLKILTKDKSTIGVAVTMPSTPPRPPWSNWIGPFGAYKIYCENGKFVHDFLHTCFDENVALQRMTEAVGEKWTAPDNTDN